MSALPPSILLLTEDSGADAPQVLRALTERTLRLVAPGTDMDRVALVPAEAPARQAMRFNGWKARDGEGHKKRTELARALATQLARQDRAAFVFFHVDGDRPWSESQRGALSENVNAFERQVLPGVRLLLEQHGQVERLDRLFLIVPFYSVEAWLYQNTDELVRLYARHHPGHADLATLEAWRAQPGDLDEVPQVKRRLIVRDQHNLQLAQVFPARRAHEVEKSYHRLVEQLRASAPLISALDAAQR